MGLLSLVFETKITLKTIGAPSATILIKFQIKSIYFQRFLKILGQHQEKSIKIPNFYPRIGGPMV